MTAALLRSTVRSVNAALEAAAAANDDDDDENDECVNETCFCASCINIEQSKHYAANCVYCLIDRTTKNKLP